MYLLPWEGEGALEIRLFFIVQSSFADVERTKSRAREERAGVAVGRHRLQVHACSRYSAVLVGAARDSTSSPIPPTSTGNPSLARCNDINASCRPKSKLESGLTEPDR
uniref:Uncharacterized protein n=1 Tax=Oryza punctata TaxID=4537 RepID=A0A0E0KJ97_ORYPU